MISANSSTALGGEEFTFGGKLAHYREVGGDVVNRTFCLHIASVFKRGPQISEV